MNTNMHNAYFINIYLREKDREMAASFLEDIFVIHARQDINCNIFKNLHVNFILTIFIYILTNFHLFTYFHLYLTLYLLYTDEWETVNVQICMRRKHYYTLL